MFMRVKRNWDHVFPKNLDSVLTKKILAKEVARP
jgi:hypothetical protein